MSQELANRLKIALLQLSVGTDVVANVNQAVQAAKLVKAQNPHVKVVVLPECFNCPYNTDLFSKLAEMVPQGETCKILSKLAKSLEVYIIGGSIIERVEPDKLYNSCTVWSPEGKLIGLHRKIHLFDMNIDPENGGGVKFNESAVLTPGNDITIVNIENRKVGIGICHDMRFDELARIYRNHGCEMIVYPSSFCICQGPMHWELLQRSRANDNQLYVATCSAARDNTADYVSYGHSMIVDPWGKVLHEASENSDVIIAEIDFSKVADIRRQIPIFNQRRTDVYNTKIAKQ